MRRTLLVLLLMQVALLASAGKAWAGGGNYVFEGANAAQRAEVHAALEASAFPWGLVRTQVTIHVGAYGASHARPGHIYLDAELLAAGKFAWAVVQDEYAHQVDFFLFDAATRARMTTELRARDWCYGVAGLTHSEYGCERFASTLVWAYWPSRHNAYRPTGRHNEAGAMAPARFRALLAGLIGAPRTAAGARL